MAYVIKVKQNKANNQLSVIIPKTLGIRKDDYVIVLKANLV